MRTVWAAGRRLNVLVTLARDEMTAHIPVRTPSNNFLVDGGPHLQSGGASGEFSSFGLILKATAHKSVLVKPSMTPPIPLPGARHFPAQCEVGARS